MKRVFRSAIDPLPRSLSTPGLIALVAVVMLGIGVTVLRYLDSSVTVSAASGAARAESSPAPAGGVRSVEGIRCTSSGSSASFERNCTASEPAGDTTTREPSPATGASAGHASTMFAPSAGDAAGG